MTYEETMFLLLGIKLVESDTLTEEQEKKFFEESFEIIEKTLDKSNQMWYNINVIKVSGN